MDLRFQVVTLDAKQESQKARVWLPPSPSHDWNPSLSLTLLSSPARPGKRDSGPLFVLLRLQLPLGIHLSHSSCRLRWDRTGQDRSTSKPNAQFVATGPNSAMQQDTLDRPGNFSSRSGEPLSRPRIRSTSLVVVSKAPVCLENYVRQNTR